MESCSAISPINHHPKAFQPKHHETSWIDRGIDRIWDSCKNEIEFLRNTNFSDYLAEHTIDVVMGLGVGLLCFITLGQFGAITELLGGISHGEGFLDAISTAINLARLPTTLVTALVKVSFFAFCSFVVPYLEEFVFRGAIHDLLGGKVGSHIEKGLRILANAFLFTLYHIPAMLPHVSVLLLLEIAVIGVMFAYMRMSTDNRVACTTAHMTYNSLIFTTIFAMA